MVFPITMAHFLCTYLCKRSPWRIGKSRRLPKRATRNMANTRGKYRWNIGLSRQNPKFVLAGRKTTNTLSFFYRCCPSVRRVNIGRYACYHGMTKAAWYFSRKRDHDVSKSTILSIKGAYLEEIKENGARAEEDSDLVTGMSTLALTCWK